MPLILSLSLTLFLMLLSGLYEVKKKTTTSYHTNSNIKNSKYFLSNIFATFSLSLLPSFPSFLPLCLSTVSLIEIKKYKFNDLIILYFH